MQKKTLAVIAGIAVLIAVIAVTITVTLTIAEPSNNTVTGTTATATSAPSSNPVTDRAAAKKRICDANTASNNYLNANSLPGINPQNWATTPESEIQRVITVRNRSAEILEESIDPVAGVSAREAQALVAAIRAQQTALAKRDAPAFAQAGKDVVERDSSLNAVCEVK